MQSQQPWLYKGETKAHRVLGPDTESVSASCWVFETYYWIIIIGTSGEDVSAKDVRVRRWQRLGTISYAFQHLHTYTRKSGEDPNLRESESICSCGQPLRKNDRRKDKGSHYRTQKILQAFPG